MVGETLIFMVLRLPENAFSPPGSYLVPPTIPRGEERRKLCRPSDLSKDPHNKSLF